MSLLRRQMKCQLLVRKMIRDYVSGRGRETLTFRSEIITSEGLKKAIEMVFGVG